MRERWRIWIDTGGTFTDCLGIDPRGELRRVKVLSSSALRGRVARVDPGDRRLLEVEADWAVASPVGDASAPETVPEESLFAGCRFRLLTQSDKSRAPKRQPDRRPDSAGTSPSSRSALGSFETGIVGLDRGAAAGRLRLEEPLASESAGAVFELRSPEEAPVLAARLLTGTAQGRPLPPVELRLATTRGTNALLERTGVPTVFFVTEGFADLLEIGDQARPDLFALTVRKRAPLYDRVVEVPERLAADGSVLRPLELEGEAGAMLAARVDELRSEGIGSAAVALLHSYLEPAHERALGEWLRRGGFDHVSLSAELAPLIKVLPRAETAVVDAYLAPIIGEYLERVKGALPEDATLLAMTSAGGLVSEREYRAKDSLLSGPAGGVVGAAEAGRLSGFPRIISFDMGGTSTDVARFDGAYEYLFEHRVGDARLVAPALAIETVAAGGGSVCRFEAGRLLVGPESAGASPGPACYGAGGPLTLTDVNLLLGRLDGDRFGIPVDRRAAEARLEELADAVAAARGREEAQAEALLAGCLEIADERMADAVRRISLRRGYDPCEHALVAFGGAGGQHACSLAELLGVTSVVVPRDAGLLSAVGLGAAVVERFVQRQVLEPLATAAERLGALLDELGREAVGAVVSEGFASESVVVRRRIVHLRLGGQESTLAVEVGGAGVADLEGVAQAFDAAYRELYGYPPPPREVEVESVRVVASTLPVGGATRGGAAQPGVETHTETFTETFAETPGETLGEARKARAVGRRRAYFAGTWVDVPVVDRGALAPGDWIEGPALVFERHAATVVLPGWRALLDRTGALVLRSVAEQVSAGSYAASGVV